MQTTRTVIGYVSEMHRAEGGGRSRGYAQTDVTGAHQVSFDPDAVAGGGERLTPGDEVEIGMKLRDLTNVREHVRDAVLEVTHVRPTGGRPGDTPETSFDVSNLESPASREVLRDLTWRAGVALSRAAGDRARSEQAAAMINFGESMWNFGGLGVHEAVDYMRLHRTGGRWPYVEEPGSIRAGANTGGVRAPGRGDPAAGDGNEPKARNEGPAKGAGESGGPARKAVRAGGDRELAAPPPRLSPAGRAAQAGRQHASPQR